MPICEVDPWRQQYFLNVECPPNINIPTEDSDAYVWFKPFNWVYNKLYIAESQQINCAPHGIAPTRFPVFSKPMMNLHGMGIGSKVIKNPSEYKRSYRAGYMWMELLDGEHVSTDIAVIDGKPQWWCHTKGIPLEKGTFDYWTIETKPRPALENYCFTWINKNLKKYTGMVNLETIGQHIIEVHLRFADQWPDLYGKHWADALVQLYANHEWTYDDHSRQTGYSVVLFGLHGIKYKHPPKSLIDTILKENNISSVQITFKENIAPSLHAMPPGGFRLAIINGYDLKAQFAAREILAKYFKSNQSYPRKRLKLNHTTNRA